MNSKFLIVASILISFSACKTRDYNNDSAAQDAESDAPINTAADAAEVANLSFFNNKTAKEIILSEKARFAKAHFRMFDHHDRTYYKLKTMQSNGQLPKKQWTLIHFDYHSDMYRNNWHVDAANINIGNYINTMMWKDQVHTVWWILPDRTKSNAAISNGHPNCSSIQSQNEIYWGREGKYADWQFRDGPADQLICVAKEKEQLHAEGIALPSGVKPGHLRYLPANSSCKNYERTIKFHKRTMSDLENDGIVPAISGPAILDIDADYFENSGSYANEKPGAGNEGLNVGASPKCYWMRYGAQRLQTEFKRFAETITYRMNLNANNLDYIAVARSPGYTFSNNQNEIFSFLKVIGAQTQQSSEIVPMGQDVNKF